MLSYKRIFHCKYLFDFLKEDISYQISPISPKKKHSKGSSIQFGNTESTHPLIHPSTHPSIHSVHSSMCSPRERRKRDVVVVVVEAAASVVLLSRLRREKKQQFAGHKTDLAQKMLAKVETDSSCYCRRWVIKRVYNGVVRHTFSFVFVFVFFFFFFSNSPLFISRCSRALEFSQELCVNSFVGFFPGC
jgi:hypothetical protein